MSDFIMEHYIDLTRGTIHASYPVEAVKLLQPGKGLHCGVCLKHTWHIESRAYFCHLGPLQRITLGRSATVTYALQ